MTQQYGKRDVEKNEFDRGRWLGKYWWHISSLIMVYSFYFHTMQRFRIWCRVYIEYNSPVLECYPVFRRKTRIIYDFIGPNCEHFQWFDLYINNQIPVVFEKLEIHFWKEQSIISIPLFIVYHWFHSTDRTDMSSENLVIFEFQLLNIRKSFYIYFRNFVHLSPSPRE